MCLVSAVVKVTVEETNAESMDTTDADDTETITLTRTKVFFLFMYVHIWGVCRVPGMLLVQLMGLYASWRYSSNGKDP